MNSIIKREQRIISQAVDIAEGLDMFGDARVAAILANKNKIISFGFNSSKSHPNATKYDKREGAIYPHAEVVAIYNAARKVSMREISKSTLYVARVKKVSAKSNEFVWGISKPCPACQQCIESFGIRHVIWTDEPCVCGEWFEGEEW